MDEFYLEINVILFLEWIIGQGQKYNLQINYESEKKDILLIKNSNIRGKIIYYGNGIFEEELTNVHTNENIFYLHFQFVHFKHAITLFKEMANCAIEAVNKPQVRVLLCCSGGLTTTLFASKMSELAILENLPYEISATGYPKLFELADQYDVIMFAPQISYLLTEAKERLENKKVLMIPTQIFATNDFSKALKLIYDLFKEKDEISISDYLK